MLTVLALAGEAFTAVSKMVKSGRIILNTSMIVCRESSWSTRLFVLIVGELSSASGSGWRVSARVDRAIVRVNSLTHSLTHTQLRPDNRMTPTRGGHSSSNPIVGVIPFTTARMLFSSLSFSLSFLVRFAFFGFVNFQFNSFQFGSFLFFFENFSFGSKNPKGLLRFDSTRNGSNPTTATNVTEINQT